MDNALIQQIKKDKKQSLVETVSVKLSKPDKEKLFAVCIKEDIKPAQLIRQLLINFLYNDNTRD